LQHLSICICTLPLVVCFYAVGSNTNSFVVISNGTTSVSVTSEYMLAIPTTSLVEGSADDLNNFALDDVRVHLSTASS